MKPCGSLVHDANTIEIAAMILDDHLEKFKNATACRKEIWLPLDWLGMQRNDKFLQFGEEECEGSQSRWRGS
jgi:hypothetical protein